MHGQQHSPSDWSIVKHALLMGVLMVLMLAIADHLLAPLDAWLRFVINCLVLTVVMVVVARLSVQPRRSKQE